jgi:hypothetical protein
MYQLIVIFSKKLLCKVPIFFAHDFGSTKVYQKKKKKVGNCDLKKLLMPSYLRDEKLLT